MIRKKSNIKVIHKTSIGQVKPQRNLTAKIESPNVIREIPIQAEAKASKINRTMIASFFHKD